MQFLKTQIMDKVSIYKQELFWAIAKSSPSTVSIIASEILGQNAPKQYKRT